MRTAAVAGVRHIVALSIIGIDRVPYGYYQGKLRQEKVLQESPVPVSILRAAQFHEFPGQYLAKLPGPVVIVPRWRAQPVAAREVGAALARIAAGDPVAMSELAGPREEIMADMIRQAARPRLPPSSPPAAPVSSIPLRSAFAPLLSFTPRPRAVTCS